MPLDQTVPQSHTSNANEDSFQKLTGLSMLPPEILSSILAHLPLPNILVLEHTSLDLNRRVSAQFTSHSWHTRATFVGNVLSWLSPEVSIDGHIGWKKVLETLKRGTQEVKLIVK